MEFDRSAPDAPDEPPPPGVPPAQSPPPGFPPGTGFAWWEEPFDRGDGDGGEMASYRRRHSRGVRAVGLVVAVALLVASVGTTVDLVLSGSGSSNSTGGADVLTAVTSVVPLGPGGSSVPGGRVSTVPVGQVQVGFTVRNGGATAVVPVCAIDVLAGGSVVGSVVRRGDQPLAAGGVASGQVVVPTLRPVPADRLGAARVRCGS